MDLDIQIGLPDILVIVSYLAIVVGVGMWAGWTQRKSSEGSSYFLAGHSLTWPIIGLALFSTNISTIELVSLAETGYLNGLVYANTEWMAALTLVILAIFFAPFYIRSNVTTLPDFLRQRYNEGCRKFQVGIAIFSAIFIHIGFALFAGGKVLEGLFGIDLMVGITVILSLVGLYTIVGGLKAVVLAECIDTVVLVGGSIVMTVIGYDMVGGWEGITAAFQDQPEKLKLLLSAEEAEAVGAKDMTWYAILLGYPVIGIWYWCTDQTIVQRVLAAKDEKHAQVGPIFAGFIKILPLFIFVMPGVICYALIHQHGMEPLPLGPDGEPDAAQTYAHLINTILPVGVKGVVAAAMLAALMSTVAGALNSIATVVVYDLYKPWRPQAPDKQLIRVGRIITFVAMVCAIVWAPFVAKFSTILEGNTMMITYIAPGITAVFLGGIFWRGASGKGAFITLVGGTVMGAVIFYFDFFRAGKSFEWEPSFMLTSFFMLLICIATLVIASKIYPHKHTAESERLVWKHPLEAFSRPAFPGLLNYKFLSGLLLAIMAVLYYIFD